MKGFVREIEHTWYAKSSPISISVEITHKLVNFFVLQPNKCAQLRVVFCVLLLAMWECRLQSNMAAVSSSQPLLHAARIPPGHILVSEKFHGSDIIRTLKGESLCWPPFVWQSKLFAPKLRAKFEIKFYYMELMTRLPLSLPKTKPRTKSGSVQQNLKVWSLKWKLSISTFSVHIVPEQFMFFKFLNHFH